ncbi:MAG: hypothetical protein SGJ18_15895 [Pseudomonadota bacterium]|nr:hypothetical protein [Pseudomonadota bacterium]
MSRISTIKSSSQIRSKLRCTLQKYNYELRQYRNGIEMLDKDAEQAARFYAETFPNSSIGSVVPQGINSLERAFCFCHLPKSRNMTVAMNDLVLIEQKHKLISEYYKSEFGDPVTPIIRN